MLLCKEDQGVWRTGEAIYLDEMLEKRKLYRPAEQEQHLGRTFGPRMPIIEKGIQMYYHSVV